ncbi:Gfo/Idh/MocA family protein [Actinomycetota bacterium]
MNTKKIDFDLNIYAKLPKRMDYRIGCIGAGFIMKDIQLLSYRDIGFNPIAITSRTIESAQKAAQEWNIPKVYKDYKELIKDKDIEIIDIAIPPDKQIDIIREAAEENDHIKGILAQKPLAMDYKEAVEMVDICEKAGIKLAVNHNMRYDHSFKALKTLLSRGFLGEPVIASIEMRAIPHWQDYLKEYKRLTILNMSIHHIDIFRYLFGDPEYIFASTRTDPRTKFKHTDGIAMYILEYENDLRAISIDDVWAWPGKGDEPEKDVYVKWRVEGIDGMAQGKVGWPQYPVHTPSTIDYVSKDTPGNWISPRWSEAYFPDGFYGTMAQLMIAVENNEEPEISGRDNLKTMAAVEACYRSIREGRKVPLKEFI